MVKFFLLWKDAHNNKKAVIIQNVKVDLERRIWAANQDKISVKCFSKTSDNRSGITSLETRTLTCCDKTMLLSCFHNDNNVFAMYMTFADDLIRIEVGHYNRHGVFVPRYFDYEVVSLLSPRGINRFVWDYSTDQFPSHMFEDCFILD